MRARYLAVAAIFVAALVVSGPVLAANTVVNGFQNGSFSAGTYTPNSSGFDTLTSGTPNAGAMTDWKVTAGSIDWIGSYWNPEVPGTRSLDMNGNTNGTIQQTFDTTAGASYSVSFYLSGNPDGAPTTKILDVTASGNPESTYSFTIPSGMGEPNLTWAPEAYTFTATGASTTLTFAGDPSNTGPFGPVLDDVVVAPTTSLPESVTGTCTGSCSTEVQSGATGTTGGVDASNTDNSQFQLSAAFGTGTLSCDRFVSLSGNADPLAVTTSSSSGQTVGGTVTLTFPKSLFDEVRSDDRDQRIPVCVGATQPFFRSDRRFVESSPYPYQGLLFACGNPAYKARAGSFPLQICVLSYARVGGAEQVVIQTSSFGGDPMYW